VEEDSQSANAAVRNLRQALRSIWRFSALTRAACANPLHLPGQPTVAIANNDISSMITTDGKSDRWGLLRHEASRQQLTDNSAATASNGTFQPTNPFDWREDIVASITPSTESTAFMAVYSR